MAEHLRPETVEQVVEFIRWAVAGDQPLDVRGRGSKLALGRSTNVATCLDLSRFTGITLYEPNELVMTAKAATPIAEIEAVLAKHRQHLAFEPPDLGLILGGAPGQGSIGGALACNLAGPRRIKSGAARDHFLGFHAVSGRGEVFKSGGRVMKNVTGFDLSKLMAGSMGTLATLTDVTVKVMPAPEKTRTVLVLGFSDADAVRPMTDALNSPFDVSGVAHLPATVAAGSRVSYVAGAGAAVTAIRVEGPGPSVESRCASLRALLGRSGAIEELHTRNSIALWREIRDAALVAGGNDDQIWRLSVPPASGPRVASEIVGAIGGRYFYDWGGGLIWLALAPQADAGHTAVRAAIGAGGGHAALVRAAEGVRAAVPVFQPQPDALAQLTQRVKASFDPKGILNRGRMYAGL